MIFKRYVMFQRYRSGDRLIRCYMIRDRSGNTRGSYVDDSNPAIPSDATRFSKRMAVRIARKRNADMAANFPDWDGFYTIEKAI